MAAVPPPVRGLCPPQASDHPNRLALHNLTSDPIVFEGATGPAGSRRLVDLYLPACGWAELTATPIGWSSTSGATLDQLDAARRVELAVHPPPDNVIGVRIVAVVRSDGVHELADADPAPIREP